MVITTPPRPGEIDSSIQACSTYNYELKRVIAAHVHAFLPTSYLPLPPSSWSESDRETVRRTARQNKRTKTRVLVSAAIFIKVSKNNHS